MDSKFFRVPTNPNYYESITNSQAESVAKKTIVSQRDTVPSRDSRFPGFAAPLDDGRLVTDYRPHCNENIPAGLQYGTKEWVQQNTDSIIEVSRARQARITGAIYGIDPDKPKEGNTYNFILNPIFKEQIKPLEEALKQQFRNAQSTQTTQEPMDNIEEE